MKKLNAFIPYALGSTALYDWCGKAAKSPPERILEVLDPFMAKDPHATEWGNLGLTYPIEDGRPVHDLDGTARMLMFQFNERVLPAAVRDEKVKAEFARIAEKEGRALNKKEFAQIKEDVEMMLLPKAFIRRSLVPVMVFKDRLLVFTTSAKKCESVYTRLGVITNARKVEFDVTPIPLNVSIGCWLKEMAVDTESTDPEGSPYMFNTTDFAVFKNTGKPSRVVRAKGSQMEHHVVREALKDSDYVVTELGLCFFDVDQSEEILNFTFTDRFVFKAIKLSDTTMTELQGDTADRHTTAWLTAKTYQRMLIEVVDRINETEPDDADKAAAAATEADDL